MQHRHGPDGRTPNQPYGFSEVPICVAYLPTLAIYILHYIFILWNISPLPVD
jgi:hypothetical protein